MSRLAAVHLSELRFENFGYLKVSSQRCLAQSDLQESVNLQSIKNRIHSIIFSRYAQDYGNVTSWRLVDISFQVLLEVYLDLIWRLTGPSQISGCKLSHLTR